MEAANIDGEGKAAIVSGSDGIDVQSQGHFISCAGMSVIQEGVTLVLRLREQE